MSESHPSMGVSANKQVCHCFSCNFKGDFSWLLFKSLPDQFKSYASARAFMKERYALEYRELDKSVKSVKRYEEMHQHFLEKSSTKEIPLYKIAPFMSGKETYKYFYNRGFTKAEVKKFMIGRDLDNKTVTIPIFSEDNKLLGVIGRYISKKRKKNERYKIYDFDRGSVLYPLNYFEPIEDTIILVEGQFDAITMHRYGYTNTLAKMGATLTKAQADFICDNCDTLIYLGDNDDRGVEARESDRKLLNGRVKFLIVDYPDYGKDACDWEEEDIDTMVRNAHGVMSRKIRRL